MIYSVRGKLIVRERDFVVIESSGVGFKCFVSLNTLSRLQQDIKEVMLYTYMSVKEDAMDLFGFYSPEELDCFKLLISVSGVGPKMAIALLSEFNPNRLLLAIAREYTKSLTAASGVGNKLAQRIVLELKDKVGNISVNAAVEDIKAVATVGVTSNTKEAVSALVSLGFTQSEAAIAVGHSDSSLSTEELIKNALKELSRQV